MQLLMSWYLSFSIYRLPFYRLQSQQYEDCRNRIPEYRFPGLQVTRDTIRYVSDIFIWDRRTRMYFWFLYVFRDEDVSDDFRIIELDRYWLEWCRYLWMCIRRLWYAWSEIYSDWHEARWLLECARLHHRSRGESDWVSTIFSRRHPWTSHKISYNNRIVFFSYLMRYHLFLLSLFLIVLIWSGINPHDSMTWILEVLPAIIGVGILIGTYQKFKLTNFLYTLILIHTIILCVGWHYTYAEVPLFDWIRDIFGQERNNYDKLWHLIQGFVPVFIAREIFIRKNIINGNIWLNIIAVSFCIAFSALYELLEWWVSVWSGSAGDSFLWTQWYIWDTQSDIAYATIGAIIGVVFFSRIHDRYIRNRV